MPEDAAISGLDNTTQARIRLLQAGRAVHAPIAEVGLLTEAAAILAYQPLDAGLTDIAVLAVTDSNIIVGNGTNWVAESGSTARTSLGLGTGDSPTFTALTLSDGQVVFPGTQVPSAGANTLDDYEEGVWTPQMTFNGSSSGVTYTTQTGRYTKIGRLVYLEGEVLLSSNGSGVGAAAISNLPFTPGVVGGTGVVMLSGGSTLIAGATGILSAGSATISIRQGNTAGSQSSSDTNVTDTGRFFINATFSV